MKKILLLLVCSLACTAGCGKSADNHDAQSTANNSVSVNSSGTAPTADASASENPSSAGYPQNPSDDYPYDIAADRKTFDASKINIVVGDKLYMTQINDWYTNFSDYAGKSVEIEGYYMTFNNYKYVGRKGPTCPYCTGGYVNFEFQSNENLSALVSESSWIKVTGILREGKAYPGSGQAPEPFYYIEAMSVDKMDQVGVATISN